MENEQMNQKPTYEQVMSAYNSLARDFEDLKMELNAVKTDAILAKVQTMLSILKEKDLYNKKIVKLAEWNLEHMLAKPKN